MVLQNWLLRARFSVQAAIDLAVRPFRSPYAPGPARELELSELEDRVLFSAGPAALLPQTVDAAPLDAAGQSLDPTAGNLDQAVLLFLGGCLIRRRVCESGTPEPNFETTLVAR